MVLVTTLSHNSNVPAEVAVSQGIPAQRRLPFYICFSKELRNGARRPNRSGQLWSGRFCLSLFRESTGGLVLGADAASQVREEDEAYASFMKGFVEYTDVLNDKLPKARAIAWLLHSGEPVHQETIQDAALTMVDLIDEVIQAHERLYRKFAQYRDREH